MAVDLERLEQSISTPAGLTIECNTDAEMLKEKHIWIRRLLAEGQLLGPLVVDVSPAYGFGPDADWQHFIALLEGQAVSCGSVFCATGVPGIYAVSTLPEARRRGIGAAITVHGLLDARERGYRVGVLQSSRMGNSVYRRLGFRTCFMIRIYTPAG